VGDFLVLELKLLPRFAAYSEIAVSVNGDFMSAEPIIHHVKISTISYSGANRAWPPLQEACRSPQARADKNSLRRGSIWTTGKASAS